MKNKKILKWIGAVAPILSLPILSASCLEKVNLILNGNREGEKDKENPETSTNPTPNPTTPPKDSTEPIKKEDEKPKITHSEIINNFKEVYSNNAMLDANPKAFNDAGNFLAYDLRTDPEFPYSLKLPDPLTIILKHPTAIWYYSGIKKYYDYILQMDNVYNNKQQLQNRLNRLFNEGSTEFINTNYSTKRLGIVWKDALTYNLDKIINAYEDIYTKSSEFSSMYHGVLPLDFGEKETELLEDHNENEADWNNHGQNLERKTMNPKISYKEMYDISKQFYERLDRHFLQERINHKNKTLSLEAVPNKDIKAADYFNDWYNFKFPFPVDQSSKNYIGVFSYGFQTYLEKRWNPYDFYNNSIVLAPFKAIQNSNIMATSLKVLKYYLHFKLVLSMLSNNPNKSFLEQLDETKNEKLQEFYKKYNYTNGFSSLLEVLINSVSKILDPTIYVNFIDEFGNKHYFYDEWKDSLILGRKNHIQDSNQRQFYIFALNLYNKLLMPFNYLINNDDSEIEFNTDSVNSDLSTKNIRKFKKEFYKEFYQPIFGEIKKMQEATDEAKTRSAKIMIKNFLENSIIKKPDNNNQLTENKNLINIYELRAKDITGIEFNEYWLNPNKDENE